MVDYQCPTCLETLDRPKYEPMALKCGHIICSTCLPKTVKRNSTNHICGMCRKECQSQDVYRIYLPTPVQSLPSTSSRSSSSGHSSRPSFSDSQVQQANAIAIAASQAGVESSQPELQSIVTSAEHFYVGIEEHSGPAQDTLDALLSVLTGLRQKLVYAKRLDSAKQVQHKLQLDIDMHKNELISSQQRLRQSESEVSRLSRDLLQSEKRAKRAEAKAAQWEQQANAIEDRRYTEWVRADGATSILRSQVSVLQKEVQEQTRRKLSYKKKYYSMKQTRSKGQSRRCCCAASDDDALEILSSTSTVDEAEISAAFSTPYLPENNANAPSNAQMPPSPSESQEDSDDDSLTVIYGPPPSQQSKKRKFSDASVSSTSTTMSIPAPLTPEEQQVREDALDARFSKRLRAARDEGVKEGWVPPDWKAKVVMADRIKEMKKARKRSREEMDKDTVGVSGTGVSAPTKTAQSGARVIRSRRM